MSLRDNTERHLFYKDIYKHRGYAYPQGCIEKYEAADYWRNFYNIKEIDALVGIDFVTASDAAKEVSRYAIKVSC